jgi:6-phosphogluconolactonase
MTPATDHRDSLGSRGPLDPLGPRGGAPVLPGGGADPGEPTVVILPDPDAVAAAAADRIVESLAQAVGRRGRADVALTGGSAPPALYRRLVAPDLRDRVPWDRVHLWWGDDRYVPRGHPLSNVLSADQALLAKDGAPIPIPASHVHPFPTDRAIAEGLGGGWCAATYGAQVAAALPSAGGWPAFDLVLVGIGVDGHLLSVFPGSEALASDRIALSIPAPGHIEPHVPRVTLNPAILGVAGQVLAMATGAAKADIVARILDGPRDPIALPASLARRTSATWLLDAAAASRLRHAD